MIRHMPERFLPSGATTLQFRREQDRRRRDPAILAPLPNVAGNCAGDQVTTNPSSGHLSPSCNEGNSSHSSEPAGWADHPAGGLFFQLGWMAIFLTLILAVGYLAAWLGSHLTGSIR